MGREERLPFDRVRYFGGLRDEKTVKFLPQSQDAGRRGDRKSVV